MTGVGNERDGRNGRDEGDRRDGRNPPPDGQAKARRRGRPGYDKESLLRVAVKVFNERGYDGTSMDELSKRLGISKSAIYYHVAGKDELLQLAVDRALDGLFAAADQAGAVEGRAIDRLEHLVRASVAVLVAEQPFVTLLLRVRGNTAVEKRALARRREFDHLVSGLVAQAEADGDIRPDIDPAITARLLFGLVNSLIEWYRPRRGGAGADEIADALCKVAFDGLRTRPPE
ncbi:TetR/AcrR family transcriptional regulator [Actinomadura sp. KC216]|nr:TetR/AcrR family transcriptional regulator [Actinomadura sp. KC216]